MQLSKYRHLIFIIIAVLLVVFAFEQEKRKVLSTSASPLLDFLPITDCGVVLTGSPGRLREAFEVLGQKKIRRLIVSGVYKDTRLHEIFPHLPFYPEIDPESIILEKISGSTYGNAVQSLLVAEALKCKSVLLMTSQLHMYRALRTFKSRFPQALPITPYAIVNPVKEATAFDIYFETLKSLFYPVLSVVLG